MHLQISDNWIPVSEMEKLSNFILVWWRKKNVLLYDTEHFKEHFQQFVSGNENPD